MTEEMKIVTLKMTAEEAEALTQYLMDHDIDNRSDFIREAIRTYMVGASETNETGEDGIYVRLNGIQLQTIENMRRDGTIFDAESYIRKLVENDLIPQEAVQDSKMRAFRAAQQAARNQ
ncbi:hypothetical protein TALC_00965 [Thermoplasmatales archaeon BRNA1]|nr:hypothetical protein TALC_00965 [Thermoplasmatales archaeon BRNA1]